ncbi:hypothetical protein MMC12_008052 [Toensbergia leucococca]|nr:hypothetical protein [Toensbergia leucococca]
MPSVAPVEPSATPANPSAPPPSVAPVDLSIPVKPPQLPSIAPIGPLASVKLAIPVKPSEPPPTAPVDPSAPINSSAAPVSPSVALVRHSKSSYIEEFQLLELKDVLLVDVVSGSSKTLRRKMGQREAVLKELSQVANDHYFKVFFKSSRATKTITPESAFKAAHDPDSDEVVVNDDQDVEAESVTQRVTNYRMGVHKYKSEKHQKFKHSEEMALLP